MLDFPPSVELDGHSYVPVLDFDLDLRAAVPDAELALARRRLLARTVEIDPGAWGGSPADPEGLGLMLLDGLVTRDVDVAGGCSRELLGGGDILRPWDDDGAFTPVLPRVSWTILEPTRLVVLDGRFSQLAGRWPSLGAEIVHRMLRRSRWLAIRMAIGNLRSVADRVMLLLWHLAGNWGKVRPDGTLVPHGLTHETIAGLVGARRQSVTTAISKLRVQGRLERVDEGWLLRESPPAP